jgi:hypothetical protein
MVDDLWVHCHRRAVWLWMSNRQRDDRSGDAIHAHLVTETKPQRTITKHAIRVAESQIGTQPRNPKPDSRSRLALPATPRLGCGYSKNFIGSLLGSTMKVRGGQSRCRHGPGRRPIVSAPTPRGMLDPPDDYHLFVRRVPSERPITQGKVASRTMRWFPKAMKH